MRMYAGNHNRTHDLAGRATPSTMIHIIMVTNSLYWPLVHNAIIHYAQLPAASTAPGLVLQLHAHGLDDGAHASCINLTLGHRGAAAMVECVRAHGCCDGYANREQMKEIVLMYKMRAVEAWLTLNAEPVVLLDADSLVLTRECFRQWVQVPSHVVAQFGGCPLCTPHQCSVLGSSFNTGVALFRTAAVAILRRVLSRYDRWLSTNRSHTQSPFHHHCYDQELFNDELIRQSPRWLDFGKLLTVQVHLNPSHVHLNLTILKFSNWPVEGGTAYVQTDRGNNGGQVPGSYGKLHVFKKRRSSTLPGTQGVPALNKTCIVHLAGASDRFTPWMKRGLWHLPIPRPPPSGAPSPQPVR